LSYNTRKIIILGIITATLFTVAVFLTFGIKVPLPEKAPEGPIIIPLDIEPTKEVEQEPEQKQEEVFEDHSGQVVYLTFDDGPSQYTRELLDILDEYNIKATFFVTSQYPEYTPLIKEINNRGHKIGVHTFSHDYKNIYSSVENYITDYNAMNDLILAYTGDYSDIFRFPGGTSNSISSQYCPGIMEDLTSIFSSYGINWYDWNVDATNQDILEAIKSRKQSVVLLHDSRSEDLEKIKQFLPKAQKSHYTFKPLDSTVYCQHPIRQ